MSKLGDLIEGVQTVDVDAPAMEFHGAWWTWGELRSVGKAVDEALTTAGLGAQSRIGMAMANCPEVAAALLSVLATDRCLVTLNPNLPDDRLSGDILSLRPPALVAPSAQWAREAVLSAAREIGCLGVELTGDKAAPVRLVPGLESVTGSDLRRTTDVGVGIEMLTSGTTGTPKRIPLKTRTLEQAVLDAGVYDGRSSQQGPQLRAGALILSAPFAHIGGIFGLANTLVGGRQMVLLEKFAVAPWVDAVRRHRPRVASAPPSALRMILDANVPKEDLASLVAFRAATAPLDPDLGDEFTAKYGIPVLQNYSATEFAGAGAGWTLDDYKKHYKDKRGSVGRVNPGLKARIVDPETGEPLPFGQQGLLELFGAQLGDGKSWMRTTDLAVLDADDFLWINGRADNAIIRGGFKVIPDDLVRAIEQHPAIREAAVVSLPDPRLGEVPAAAYLIRSGMSAPTDDEMKAFLREKLLPYQVPVRVMAVTELPRTPSLKVSQPDLRKMFMADAS